MLVEQKGRELMLVSRGARDEFPEPVKRILASRVGFRCSRPACGRDTSGPQEDSQLSINIGVAAHITAAAPGGARFDESLSPEQRSSPENGIWLCQSCAKLVDNDESRYTVERLRQWRRASEDLARLRLEDPDSPDAAFRELEELMPALLEEMRADIQANPTYREFILKKKAWVYNSDKPHLEYYYDDHPDLDQLMIVLANHGFVQDITYNNTSRFVFREEFVRYLRSRTAAQP